MTLAIERFPHFWQDLTTRLTYKYFQYRIDTPDDPYRILFRPTPYKVVFILSHMRSGSSLLTHLLVSNPEIIGYGETHLEYTDERDFKALLFKLYWRFRDLNMNHTYLLDKVLHDQKFIQSDFLRSDRIRTVFLLREPKRTLASILDIKPHQNEEQALEYYIHRLSTLENYAKLINSKEKSLFVTYDQVVNRSSSVFESLQNHLQTRVGFSEEYKVLKTTGTRGIGDSSENIKAGRIIKQTRKLDIPISDRVLDRARSAFDRCHDTLSDYCQCI
ncbi:sulfotransferase family protein [Pannus brasiliensis]